MKRVYVAGAYSAGNVIDVLRNIGRGEKMCAELFRRGYAPFCPWHDKSYVIDNFDKPLDINMFYEYSISWLEVSDMMLVINENSETSVGTKNEIEFAKNRNIPIYYDIDHLPQRHTNSP